MTRATILVVSVSCVLCIGGTSSLLSTAGGVVFVGESTGEFEALHLLLPFLTRLGSAPPSAAALTHAAMAPVRSLRPDAAFLSTEACIRSRTSRRC